MPITEYNVTEQDETISRSNVTTVTLSIFINDKYVPYVFCKLSPRLKGEVATS